MNPWTHKGKLNVEEVCIAIAVDSERRYYSNIQRVQCMNILLHFLGSLP